MDEVPEQLFSTDVIEESPESPSKDTSTSNMMNIGTLPDYYYFNHFSLSRCGTIGNEYDVKLLQT